MEGKDKKKLAAILLILMVLGVGIAFLVMRYGWWQWGTVSDPTAHNLKK